jgi:hypothetical protein
VAKPELSRLSEAERAELAAWLAEHAESLPAPVRAALEQHQALCEGLRGSRYKLSQVLVELRRALGSIATSERRLSKDPLGPLSNGDGARPKSERARLELDLQRYETLQAWHKDLAKQHGRKLKAIRSKLMKIPVDPELGENEYSEAEQAGDAAELREHMARLRLGGGAQPGFESSKEAFMTGAQVATSEETLSLPAPVDEEHDGKVLDTIVEERERFDFCFTVKRLTLQVEKKVVQATDGERRVVSASTAALGPRGYAVTWGFLAHMVLLVVQYAMPMNRLATLLSTDAKRFSAGALARMLRYVAHRFAPIYLALFDSLADSDILYGDDTSCRVTEVSRQLAARDNAEPPPWHGYRTAAAAQQQLVEGAKSLAAMLAAELGFEFERRTGDGTKKALHTTTISGRSDGDDPRSLIVLYRSHLRGFGNLLETLLDKRSPKYKALTIQSDLATVNLVADEQLRRRFDIRYAGCASHARRPFALYEDEDPDYCAAMLHMFKGLFIHEHGLNLAGRNEQNVRAVRGVDSRAQWQEIKELAEEMSTRWSRETNLGEGARYITRNLAKLTANLDDPRLELTNNFSYAARGIREIMPRPGLCRVKIAGASKAVGSLILGDVGVGIVRGSGGTPAGCPTVETVSARRQRDPRGRGLVLSAACRRGGRSASFRSIRAQARARSPSDRPHAAGDPSRQRVAACAA